MKGVEVEEFRDVEVYPDEELFVVVVQKNFKLCLDRVVVKGNTQVGNIWRSRIEIFSSSVDSKICICQQMQTDLQKAEDWASRETVSCVDLSTDDLVFSTDD
ncbi:hypothetical protein Taro_003922 [Colocasia esculenta]|uniref:Uncharacterized protein n=1 Tax=Colocasia esculenta TaxID=4460 RepID=A0A843TGT1_COLES|nr:hypothetical protein [Colocasia esculenta]